MSTLSPMQGAVKNKMKKTLAVFFFLLPFLFVVMPLTVAAKERLTVKGHREGEFARVFFYCRQPVNFNVSLQGNRLSVRFDRSFDIDFGDLQRSMKDELSGAAESGDGKTVILFLKSPDYRVRQFVSESFVGVDLLPTKVVEKQPAPAVEKKPETTAPPKKETKAPPSKKTEEAENKDFLNPEGPPEPPTPAIPEAPGPIYKDSSPPSAPITLASRLLFPWNGKVNAAVFTRGSTLWIIFDAFRRVDLSRFMKQHADIIFYGEQMHNRNYTVVRLDLTRPLFPKMRRRDYSWEVELYENPLSPAYPITVAPEFRSPPGPYVLLRAFPDRDPLRLVDPEIGDTLVVIPLFQEGSGVETAKAFVDFNLLPTAQGIVVPLVSDEVRVEYLSKGVEITSPSLELFRDSQLAAPLPASVQDPLGYEAKLQKQKADAAKANQTAAKPYSMFPFDEWQRGGNAAFIRERQALDRSIAAASIAGRAVERMKLAQFYLAHRLAPEALTALNYLQYRDPVASQGEDVRRTRALALYLLRHYREAKEAFATLKPATPAETAEIGFWKQAVAVVLGEGNMPLSYARYKDAFLKRYPLWLRQRLVLEEVVYHIRQKSWGDAKKLLNVAKRLKGKKYSIENDVAYFQGVVLANTGNTKKAMALWEPLTKDILDRRNRARAEFAIMEVRFREGEFTREEAIDRLARIRLMWRGDDLELNVLKILGQLYIDNKQYREGMQIWKDIVTYFPNTADALFIAKKMIQTFVYLFNQGGADRLSPMEAVALYNGFKEWTPIGKPGEIMVQNLAERLFQADLLEQAEALLSHQVKFRLEGEEKVKIGARLALLYLLDKKPEVALEVLDSLKENGLPDIVALKRRHLRAQALVEMKKYKKALAVLDGDNTLDANIIRQDIFWRTKQWLPLMMLLSPYVALMADTQGMLTPEESDALLKLTVVYSLGGNAGGLEKLYDDFKGRVPEARNHAVVFEFLAGKLDTVNYKNFDASTQLKDFRTFLDKYGMKAKQEGLKAAAGT